MNKRFLGTLSVLTIAATSTLAGSVAYVAPVETVIAEESNSMGGSGLWLLPLLAIALIFFVSQSDDEPQFSDARIKRDIKQVGITESGLTLYEFRYVFGRKRYVGVMAQDVLMHTPEAVVRSVIGFYKVNYAKLGLEMRAAS